MRKKIADRVPAGETVVFFTPLLAYTKQRSLSAWIFYQVHGGIGNPDLPHFEHPRAHEKSRSSWRLNGKYRRVCVFSLANRTPKRDQGGPVLNVPNFHLGCVAGILHPLPAQINGISKMAQDKSPRKFSPDEGYPIETVAEILGQSTRWVRENLINTRECRFKQRGHVILFKGSWIIQWMMDDFIPPGEEDAA